MADGDESTFLAQIALDWKLIERDQLQACLREQQMARSRGKEVLLGKLLIDRGWLKTEDLERIVREQRLRLERLAGLTRYELRERVGEGGTAVVYQAWDREGGRAVAVKLLKEEVSLDPVMRERFQRELTATRSISHPNVVAVYDGGEAGGRFFLVMELVKGRPLTELLRAGRRTEKEWVTLLQKVARGVGAAHEKGIVHRDLKPANILVLPMGEPKVADFGLARLARPGDAVTKAVLGTPAYMAPEQITAKELSPRTDVFALGAMLYEALTGAPPHAGRSEMETYRKILYEAPVMPSVKNPGISRLLERIILRSLEKDPAARHADANELASTLA